MSCIENKVDLRGDLASHVLMRLELCSLYEEQLSHVVKLTYVVVKMLLR